MNQSFTLMMRAGDFSDVMQALTAWEITAQLAHRRILPRFPLAKVVDERADWPGLALLRPYRTRTSSSEPFFDECGVLRTWPLSFGAPVSDVAS